MIHLLDTNVFINSGHFDYPIASFPGFWDWIDAGSEAGRIKTIPAVKRELSKKDDIAKAWLQSRDSLLVEPPPDLQTHLIQVVKSTSSLEVNAQEKSKFLGGADPQLIAYALAMGATVVTGETRRKPKKKVKIPVVCDKLNVACMSIRELIALSKVRFGIQDPSRWK